MEGVGAEDVGEQAAREYNPEGWPRGISLQLTRNLQTSRNASASSSNTRTDTQGIQLDAFLEIPNFGALSLHTLALGGRNATGLTSFSLRQVGLPFDGGWRADNAIGTTNLLLPELARRSGRLALPSALVLGVSTLWRNEAGSALVLGASVGEPGRFEGFPQSRFVGLGGEVRSAFIQDTRGEWTLAAAAAEGSNILPEVAPVPGQAAARVSPRATYLGIAQNAGAQGIQWQLNAVESRSPEINHATGIWADATWRDGGHRHQASAFRFTEGLTWIDRPLASNLQGAAYRYDFHSLRADLSANVESFASVSGNAPSGWYISASGRRRLSLSVSTGGGFAVRTLGTTSAAGFGHVQWDNALGVSRLQFDLASTQGGERSQGVTVDHAFYVENGLSLSSTLSFERVKSATVAIDLKRATGNALGLGLNARVPISDSLSLQGGARARNVVGAGGLQGTSLTATLALDWQISQAWSFGGSLYANRGVLTENIGVQSPLTVAEIVRTRPNDRGFFLSLRYASGAGSPIVPLGGRPGSGFGRIEGNIYLDANGNGMREAAESGAANIVVLLDGKFSVRTDASGNFEFANVVAGSHSLTVMQDDLPLPWTVDSEQKIPANVSTRDVTRVEVGAKRLP